MMDAEIVKVQRPLMSSDGDYGKVLVYAEGHRAQIEQPLDEDLSAKLGDDIKAFFHARLSDGGDRWIIGEKVDWQDW